MDEKSKQSIDMRKFQELSENLKTAGFHKEIAKYRKAIYDSYIEVGFSPEQALELLKADFQRHDSSN